jgi:hypothetical protein
MSRIRIQHTSDRCECAGCGPSYAKGARVYVDGALAFELEPIAHCYDSYSYDAEEILRAVLEHMGHSLEVQKES